MNFDAQPSEIPIPDSVLPFLTLNADHLFIQVGYSAKTGVCKEFTEKKALPSGASCVHCASGTVELVPSRRQGLWLWSCPGRWWITPEPWRSSLCLVSRDAVEYLMLFQDIFIIIIVIIITDINNSHVICKWIISSYWKGKSRDGQDIYEDHLSYK